MGALPVMLDIFFLGWRRNPPIDGRGRALSGDNMLGSINLLSQAKLSGTNLPQAFLCLDFREGSELDTFLDAFTLENE